jgi:3-hydroxybutyryl-CoA dehydrogenase
MKVKNIKQVAVIGAGAMGLDIGLEFARFGYPVNLYNTRKSSSDDAMRRASRNLDFMVEMELLSRAEAKKAQKRLNPTTDFSQAALGADYIIESGPEVLSVKQEIFKKLDDLCPPPTILATNTSMLSVTAIASVTKRPERVIATNYYQPAHLVPLVEIVGGQRTDSSVIKWTVEVLRSLHKKTVVIPKEFPGLIAGNRIQLAMMKEIQALVDEGMVTPQQVDDILMFGLSRRMVYAGFFRRLDMVGLDFLRGALKEWGLPPWRALDERVERGELGLKTGKGFYNWPGNAVEEFNRGLNTQLARFLKRDIEEGTI